MCEDGKTAGKENVPSECAGKQKSRDLTPGTFDVVIVRDGAAFPDCARELPSGDRAQPGDVVRALRIVHPEGRDVIPDGEDGQTQISLPLQ